MGKGSESSWQISDKGIREEQRKRGTLKNKSARVGMPLASVCRWDHFQTHSLERDRPGASGYSSWGQWEEQGGWLQAATEGATVGMLGLL